MFAKTWTQRRVIPKTFVGRNIQARWGDLAAAGECHLLRGKGARLGHDFNWGYFSTHKENYARLSLFLHENSWDQLSVSRWRVRPWRSLRGQHLPLGGRSGWKCGRNYFFDPNICAFCFTAAESIELYSLWWLLLWLSLLSPLKTFIFSRQISLFTHTVGVHCYLPSKWPRKLSVTKGWRRRATLAHPDFLEIHLFAIWRPRYGKQWMWISSQKIWTHCLIYKYRETFIKMLNTVVIGFRFLEKLSSRTTILDVCQWKKLSHNIPRRFRRSWRLSEDLFLKKTSTHKGTLQAQTSELSSRRDDTFSPDNFSMEST